MTIHTKGPWQVLPTGNARGDLAICGAGASKPVNRLATVPVRDGYASNANAVAMAAAPEALSLLKTIDRDGLLDRRERGTPDAEKKLRAILAKVGQ